MIEIKYILDTIEELRLESISNKPPLEKIININIFLYNKNIYKSYKKILLGNSELEYMSWTNVHIALSEIIFTINTRYNKLRIEPYDPVNRVNYFGGKITYGHRICKAISHEYDNDNSIYIIDNSIYYYFRGIPRKDILEIILRNINSYINIQVKNNPYIE